MQEQPLWMVNGFTVQGIAQNDQYIITYNKKMHFFQIYFIVVMVT